MHPHLSDYRGACVLFPVSSPLGVLLSTALKSSFGFMETLSYACKVAKAISLHAGSPGCSAPTRPRLDALVFCLLINIVPILRYLRRIYPPLLVRTANTLETTFRILRQERFLSHPPLNNQATFMASRPLLTYFAVSLLLCFQTYQADPFFDPGDKCKSPNVLELIPARPPASYCNA